MNGILKEKFKKEKEIQENCAQFENRNFLFLILIGESYNLVFALIRDFQIKLKLQLNLLKLQKICFFFFSNKSKNLKILKETKDIPTDNYDL